LPFRNYQNKNKVFILVIIKGGMIMYLDLTVDEIRKLREENYEQRKNKSRKEYLETIEEEYRNFQKRVADLGLSCEKMPKKVA
jgi:deoxyadenosine/deoxycytidine kinase